MDRLLLKNMRVYGYHGVFPEENEIGCNFEVDAELYFPFKNIAVSDAIQQTVNYAEVYEFVKEVFNRNTYKLIETVAVNLADEIFFKFNLKRVVIRVRKPEPPVDGSMAYAEAQVELGRK